ncbi:geranylgeranyl reductase family protein [Pseudohalocynthiibacter aestuariivivens]|nr:geranylgeranyl reductase family protein [Pseudohalocynthiibacter aestuariivivens]QIE45563.1 geranylgeranyl reductase family protein [Pseudohalocynthiibacter aestuariivivens]
MPTFDLIILGAGPAGSAAAVTARQAGLSVAVIDKAVFPRAKLCGGFFTGRAEGYYRDIFQRPLDPQMFQPREKIAFYLDGTPLGDASDTLPLYLTMRWDMDAHLFDLAVQAGAADFSGHRVAALDLAARSVVLDGGTTLWYQSLIGADGVQSMVARALFGQSFDKTKIGFALEVEAPPQAENAVVRIDFDAASWGYGWQFPKRASTTIGIGGLQSQNSDIQARLATYRARLGDDSPARVKGHFLPFGNYRRVPGRGAVLLAGDAAGFVDPITGEGIAYALQSGHMAAIAAANAIRTGQPDSAMRHYARLVRPIQRSLRLACFLRPLIFASRLRPFFRRAFANSTTVKHAYLSMLSGKVEYPQLMRLTARRLPGALWRSLRRP